MAALPIVEADAAVFAHGETEDRPRPVPNARGINDRAAPVNAPPMTAAQDTPKSTPRFYRMRNRNPILNLRQLAHCFPRIPLSLVAAIVTLRIRSVRVRGRSSSGPYIWQIGACAIGPPTTKTAQQCSSTRNLDRFGRSCHAHLIPDYAISRFWYHHAGQ